LPPIEDQATSLLFQALAFRRADWLAAAALRLELIPEDSPEHVRRLRDLLLAEVSVQLGDFERAQTLYDHTFPDHSKDE